MHVILLFFVSLLKHSYTLNIIVFVNHYVSQTKKKEEIIFLQYRIYCNFFFLDVGRQSVYALCIIKRSYIVDVTYIYTILT